MEHFTTAFSSRLLHGGHGVTKRTSVFNVNVFGHFYVFGEARSNGLCVFGRRLYSADGRRDRQMRQADADGRRRYSIAV